MKMLLTVTAMIEMGGSVALLCCPSAAVTVLLGSGLDAPAAVALGRLAGAALLALGVACWLARGAEQSGATKGVITAMTVYNVGAVVILGSAGVQLRPVGIAVWPAVAIHAAMAIWCIECLRRRPTAKLIETPT
jgi:hypothetical protein